MSYALSCLEMIWFPYYHFIQIGVVQADSKLQVTSLVPPSKHKAVNPWGGFMHWLQNSHIQHLVNLLFKRFFQVYWIWPTRGLLGCNT